jgi:hypothetical protein
MTKQPMLAALVAAFMLGAIPVAIAAQGMGAGARSTAGMGPKSGSDAIGAIDNSKNDSNDPGVQVRCPTKTSNKREKQGTIAAKSAANCPP